MFNVTTTHKIGDRYTDTLECNSKKANTNQANVTVLWTASILVTVIGVE